MSLLSRFFKYIGINPTPSAPDEIVSMEAQPVHLNPTPSTKDYRNASRLVRLYQAQIKNKGNDTPEAAAARLQLRHLLAASGHPIPKNLDEALKLQATIGSDH